jgi:hypothetical protein
MTAYLAILLVALVIVSFIAYLFHFQLSAVRAKEESLRRSADEATAQAQKASKELESTREELTRRRSEASDLREKLNEMRSRQHKQRESDRRQKGGAEAELRDDLELAQRHLEEERARVDVLSRDAEGMHAELVRLRDAHRKAEEALKTAQATAARGAQAPAAPAPISDSAAAAKVEEAQKRVDLLDKQTREARKKAAEIEEELKRTRTKVSTATRNHLLAKSELDLFKEKLVWSEKRVVELERLLFENKIALPEREVAPQPKSPQLAPGIIARESANTGGEGVVTIAADYVPEPTTTDVSAETPAASTTSTAGEAAAASEPAPASAPAETPAEAPAAASLAATGTEGAESPAEAPEPRPEAVPPIRRPRSAVESAEPAAKTE